MFVDSLLTLLVVWLTIGHGSSIAQGAEQRDTIKVSITCDNKLTFYADGHVIVDSHTSGYDRWEKTKHVTVPANTNVYGIKCVDTEVVAGIIASFEDGTVTDQSWRCTNKKPRDDWLTASYNASNWKTPFAIWKNNRPSMYWSIRGDISRQAYWIWTSGWRGTDKTVYCRKVNSVVSEWAEWSAWSDCTGDCQSATQTRSRRCNGQSCSGSDQETKKCVPIVKEQDCARCTLNAANIGYLASCDDAAKYYQCRKAANGGYQLSLMSCPLCTIWDQTQLTCVRDNDLENCESGSGELTEDVTTFGSTCVRGDLRFGIVPEHPTRYIMYNFGTEVEMSCPRDTEFNITQCGCVTVESSNPSEEEELLPELCLDFEKMGEGSKWGFSQGRYWIGNHGKSWDSKHVQVSYDRCIEGVKCAKFAGESYLSVDSLANAFHSWQTFSISFWIWPDHRGTMGLFTNGLETGACSSLPTVAMTTTNEQLNGRVAFKDKVAIVKGRLTRSSWNHVVLIKDDDVIMLYVNGMLIDKHEMEGVLLPSQCPMLFGVGENESFFQGRMDEICLFKGPLTKEQISEEYHRLAGGYTGARYGPTGARYGSTGARYGPTGAR